MSTGETILYALLGGLLPTLLWLWFWLREDCLHPEPRRLIVLTFLAGMFVVLLVLPLERFAAGFLGGSVLLIAWAAIEELMKFGAAYLMALRRRAVDEPIDAVLYMITAALGFAALENALFLLGPLSTEHFLVTLMTGNLRFLGATLLHTLASATIGLSLALPFYRNPRLRRWTLLAGIILAVFLHALFNFLILERGGSQVLVVFAGVWMGIVTLLLLVEKVKRVRRPQFVYLRKK